MTMALSVSGCYGVCACFTTVCDLFRTPVSVGNVKREGDPEGGVAEGAGPDHERGQVWELPLRFGSCLFLMLKDI